MSGVENIVAVEETADEEEQAPEEKGDVHARLQYLGVAVGSLVDLAGIVD